MPGRRIEVRGTVQGVGFRPWVVRTAQRAGVTGRVRNHARGVTIEAFGADPALDSFIQKLRTDAPPSARLVELRSSSIPEERLPGFEILSSRSEGDKALSIPPDLATCSECHAELFDASNRRHGYAFTNCTACGPRFTIATAIPYDREATTMSAFEMCAACRREYDDILDRRFHAQPNACPDCGPELELVRLDGGDASGDPLQGSAILIQRGAIVAVKGLGGFHLACDATNAEAVRTLRAHKHRDERPFAVMVADLETARSLAEISEDEEALLVAPERSIVLLTAKPGSAVAREVSPDTPLLGLFLPYTPLHHLMMAAVGRPLVMTSANVSDEPICRDNDEAIERLDGIADAILMHDRDIAMRCDDSVARVIAGAPTVMRRSRGFVPRPIYLEQPVTMPILACGAHLKNTFCIATGDTAYFGPHIGTLDTMAALEHFEEAVERMETILSVRPEVIAHDLHPGYSSTRYAKSRTNATRVGVQHHHAHVLSAIAQHGRSGPVLGIAFDGTGFGEDGTSWGGEFLHCFSGRFERLASFRPIPLAGGDVAMREVWRIAYALLHDAFDGAPPHEELALFQSLAEEPKRVVAQMLDRELNTPLARGVGRYFDGFGALGLCRPIARHEGQVAIAWNFAADEREDRSYPFEVDRSRSPMEVDFRPAVRAMVADLRSGEQASAVSARFHNAVIAVTVAVARELLADLGAVPVALTGGVFQNERLCRGIHTELVQDYEVLRHAEVPPGDGGVALGQALIADAILGDKG